jgi:hypothetical protein
MWAFATPFIAVGSIIAIVFVCCELYSAFGAETRPS